MTAGGERGLPAMRAARVDRTRQRVERTRQRVGGTGRRVGGTGRRGARLLGGLAVLLALFATATPSARAAADTQAAYLAERLRADPVYVTDQLPREIPKSTTPSFERLAHRTGVPTYVLVLPSGATGTSDGEALLGAVHDRLGEDGLYVLLDDSTVTDATAYGVSAPADDAVTVAFYELPYDAGPLRSFERFVDVVAGGAEKAAARARAARDADSEPADLYIGPTDRDNQAFLTGLAITGAPLTLVLLVPYVRRWRRRRPGAPVSLKKGTAHSRWTKLALPTAAVATGLAIAVTAPHVFDETTSSASPRPRAIDLNARIDRVAEGLARDAVYQDPESPRALDEAQVERLRTRIEAFGRSEGGGPVRLLLVPQLYEDESGADEENFAYAVRDKLDGEDGVYVVADPLSGYIDVFNYGLALDSYSLLFDLPESISYGDDKADAADDHRLGERLDSLMTLLDRTERTDEPTTPGDPYPVTDPVHEDDLPSLYAADDFTPGLVMGTFAAAALLGLTAAALGVTRRLGLRRHPAPLTASALPLSSPAEPAESYLRATARSELRAMTAEFDEETADTRTRNRYDAAILLVHGEELDDLAPAALVAVIVLARAARAATAGDDSTLCCGVNPLHGPARTSRHVRVSAGSTRRRMLPLCPVCLDDPHRIPARLLRLPPDGTPYYEDELLSATPDGFTKLGRRVREATYAE
ncbi:hypothetical protein ACIPSE_04895 [Streptomyces sp. NPDC090106]|uniref:hypothetical protein n=1 Tax=Streptomyces sp. NPDC090106 TaxID=3365946 RepID=UPI00381D5310